MHPVFRISLLLIVLSPLAVFAQREPAGSVNRPNLFPAYLENDLKNDRYNHNWGYINNLGRVIIPRQFTAAGHFSEGLAPVRVTMTRKGAFADFNAYFDHDTTNKWGFINEAGTVVITFQFDEASTFSLGRARIRSNGKFGFIDKSGKAVIDSKFEDAGRFAEGLAVVRINDKYGYIGLNGEVAIQQRFDAASSFSDGLAAVKIDNLYGYIDRTGKIIVEPQFTDAGPFSEGLAKVKVKTKWGYLDKLGRIALEPQFDDASSFNDGLAAVKAGQYWGFINAGGIPVIAPQFADAHAFSEGLASVKLGDRWGYINNRGEVAIYPSYLSATPFFRGIGIVTQMQYETGYSDKNGEANVFDFITWSYIDSKGTVLAKQYRHRSNVGASGSGPDWIYENTDISLNSRPTGAVVYLVPLYDWENDSDLVNDDRKLAPYRVSQGNTDVVTEQPEKVFKGVFVLNGQRVAINVDVSRFGNKIFKVDFK